MAAPGPAPLSARAAVVRTDALIIITRLALKTDKLGTNVAAQRRKKDLPPSGSSDRSSSASAPPGANSSRTPARRPPKGWLATHGRDLRFLLIFGLLIAAYFLATTTAAVEKRFIPWYLERSAVVCGHVLNLFGDDDVAIKGNVMQSKSTRRSVSVERGCDALAPSALFVSAVLASPVALRSRLLAALGGTLLLLVINLVRIISLYLTRIHWPKAFDVMHLDVWQSLFIFFAILLWAVWATWERARARKKRDAAT